MSSSTPRTPSISPSTCASWRARLGDHLDGLAGVLVDGQGRAVEEHRVPPGLEAGRDDLAVRAVVEVQRHGHGRGLGHRPEHVVEHPGADRLHRLDRGLDDQRRAQLLGGRDHGVEREVVDHVERRHPVPLGEGAVEDLLERDDWQRTLPGRRDASRLRLCTHPQPAIGGIPRHGVRDTSTAGPAPGSAAPPRCGCARRSCAGSSRRASRRSSPRSTGRRRSGGRAARAPAG